MSSERKQSRPDTRLFQLRHLLVLLFILIAFQIVVSTIHKFSLQDLLGTTQDWYQRDAAEKQANLTATSLEMLIETHNWAEERSLSENETIAQAFNIILSQPRLESNVEEICVILQRGKQRYAFDDGRHMNRFLQGWVPAPDFQKQHSNALLRYDDIAQELRRSESIMTRREGSNTFHVFVPLFPRGEYNGALYMRNQPDFSLISQEMISSYDQTSMVFLALIFFGLLTMFYITSYTVRERDKAHELLLDERDKHLTNTITHSKEALFTKRIYHTHHKAEKVMGFIKEDLRSLSAENIDVIKQKIVKYANFISRVIYDMKWYNPPLQTMRNPIYQTDVNAVIRFIVDNIFRRTSKEVAKQTFHLALDDNLPSVPVNEFVVWEIIEPLIQNAVEHSGRDDVRIDLTTRYDVTERHAEISISDNGKGIDDALLAPTESGIKRIFRENISTKSIHPNSGYGCYLAFEIARRCNWRLDVENLSGGGCRFYLQFTV